MISLKHFGSAWGLGLLCAFRAFSAVPGAPVDVAAFAAAGQAAVSWGAPADNGGSAITGYVVTAAPGGSQCVAVAPHLTCTVTDLTNGTTYAFTVRAGNSDGTGPASTPSNSVVPRATPGAPTAVTGEARSGRIIGVSWTAPASDGGSAITAYTATATPGGASCVTSDAATLQCDVAGLSADVSYTFKVAAVNAIGTGPSSAASPSVTARDTVTPPLPPVVTNVYEGEGFLEVYWSVPADDGGRPITNYVATAMPGGAACSDATVPLHCAIGPLANGTPYTITVSAVNAIGTGAPSAPASGRPYTRPSAPTGVVGTRASTRMRVSWVAPASDGGAAITAYTATASPGNRSCTTADGSTTECEITDLVNGTTYAFTVRAFNARGEGPASQPVSLSVNGPPDIGYVVDTLKAEVSVAVTLNKINAGGTVSTWSISPAPPSGMTFNPTTGNFGGVPRAPSSAQRYTVIATGPGGSDTTFIAIVVGGTTTLAHFAPDGAGHGARVFRVPAGSGRAFVLEVRDVRGREVWSTVAAADPRRETLVPWDGTASDGAPAPAGRYLLRMHAR